MSYLLKISIVTAFVLFLFFGCDNIPDGIITPPINSYQVTNITAPDTFKFSPTDSTLQISISLRGNIVPLGDPLGFLQNAKTRETLISIKLMNIQKEDSSGMTTATITGYLEMKESFPSGEYNLVFQSVDSETQIATIIAEHKFFYNNGTENFLPEITNLKMYYETEQPTLRDSVDRNKNIIFSVKVLDANGLNDISKVSFDLFRPDSSSVGNFKMFDDGDVLHGDATAGDGIYSLLNSFGSSSQTGIWKFNFIAIDNSDSTSNIITHNLNVK